MSKKLKNLDGKKASTAKSYDPVLFRLTKIIEMLLNDEKITIAGLALEFNVSERTIQKDVYERLGSFGVNKDTQGCLCFEHAIDMKKSFLRIEEMYLLSLSLSQVEEIDDQHKETAKSVFRKVLKKEIYNPYFIKAERFQPIDKDEKLIDLLEKVILEKRVISAIFNHKPLKLYPYKIASFEGIWYLMADDIGEDKIKNYMISRLENIKILDETFERMKELNTILDEIESASYDEKNTFEVIIKVKTEIAEYFRLKKHLDSQKIIQEYKDGSLDISFMVTHDEDVDNLIKSWLPHIIVLEPVHFKQRIKDELSLYLKTLD